jgi:hypothetical protein
MILPKLVGRAVFVFSDPGGAKPLLALADSLYGKLSEIRLISDREYSFYEGFNVKVNKPDATAYDTLQKYMPDFVLTATSYTSQIELNYIEAAKGLSIPVYSFVDHWTSIRERFNFEGKEFLPDQILVIDEKAKLIGINQGVSSDILNVFGNPYYEYLRNWKPSISKSKFLTSIGVEDVGKKIVVFAPDPLSNIGGIGKYGFDEFSATEKINIVVDKLTDVYQFIIKPHPNQHTEILKKIVHPDFTLISSDTDTNILIYHSNIVIGFFSNFLIEASLFKKIVIRFLPELKVADPLSDSQIGTLIYNTEELEKSLTKP